MKGSMQDRLHGGSIVTFRHRFFGWYVPYESASTPINRKKRKIADLVEKAVQLNTEVLREEKEEKDLRDRITKMHGKQNHTGSYPGKYRVWWHKFWPFATVADVAPPIDQRYRKVLKAYSQPERPERETHPQSSGRGQQHKPTGDNLLDAAVKSNAFENVKARVGEGNAVIEIEEDSILLQYDEPKPQHNQGKRQRNRGNQGGHQNNN